MKIFLLGASGQLGRAWQFAVDHHFPEDVFLYPFTSAQLDITSKQDVRHELKEHQPDVVINCAAYTKVDEAEENRALAQAVNAEAVADLAKLSDEFHFKLIHYSTDYVFAGNKKDRLQFPNGYPENHPADPINFYGQTKWEGEQAIREHTDNYLIFRISWLCGQFGNNFVKAMLKLAQDREKIQVVDDQYGSPSFANNVVKNCIHLLNLDKTGTCHITSQGLISWYDFAKKIFKERKIDVELETVTSDEFSTKAKRPHFSKLNTGKLESIEGSVLISWQDALGELLARL